MFVSVALIYVTRDSLPVIGLLWNPRMLPFFYLMRFLMMMVGAVEVLGRCWSNVVRNRTRPRAAGRRVELADRPGSWASWCWSSSAGSIRCSRSAT